jgi:lathosterol oxidase
MVMRYLAEYLTIFVVLLFLTYLIPAGIFHWLFFVRASNATDAMRIQQRRPTSDDIRREVKDSLTSLLLFSFYSLLVYQAYKKGYTSIYLDVGRYPLWWMPAGFLAAIVLHDSYFYGTHRIMHTKTFFPLFHSSHHKSITPTPWAILSFQPLETIFQFGFFALLIFFLPMHPVTLAVYVLYDELVNAAGHSGHEFIPGKWKNHWFFKYTNAVTHHDLHHSKFRYNYGHYFNIWDRLMGTFMDRTSEKS